MLMLSLQPFILFIYYTDYEENLVDTSYLDNNDMDGSDSLLDEVMYKNMFMPKTPMCMCILIKNLMHH